MRNGNKSYAHIDEDGFERRENTPWYWKLIALLSSWMILGGYLLLPGLYALDPKLKFSQAVLSVFVVALLTAGYSFTALLCFACRNELFQAESVFLPACTSSLLGLLSIAYNLLSSSAYTFGTSAITGTVVSTTASITYAVLLLWTHRRIVHIKAKSPSRNLWSNESYYSNFVQNMYPTATSQLHNSHSRSTSAQNVPNVAEEDPINAQMALLLMKNDPRPSPDANSATFRIDLPEDREQAEREARSQELVGTPGPTHGNWTRDRAGSGRPDSLNEQAAWDRWMERGRSVQRDQGDQRSTHSRGLSREERRREIEQGR